MNKKILVSLATMGAVAALAIGGTIAFFSDTETSTGNTLTAGELDLLVDNECYYNGFACVNGVWQEGPLDGQDCFCTWEPSNLDDKVFFNLQDLKPGDYEEDTISLEVQNDAWACASITLDKDEEVSCTEPERKDETDCDASGEGELDEELYFVWWADDGDNVLEDDEYQGDVVGPYPLSWLVNDDSPYFGDVQDTMLLTLADKWHNFFGEGGALKAGKTYYIGKAFCFGDMTLEPVAQDEGGADTNRNPSNTEFFTCDGSGEDNRTQTDKVEATLEFYVEQARNNPDFACPEHPDGWTPPGTP